MNHGSCLCGAVTFQVTGPVSLIEACHCIQCRKWTSHFFASIEAPRNSLQVQGDHRITWHQSSPKARRGFCATCGSSLFFEPVDSEKHAWIGIAMGALDSSTGSKFGLHIFTTEKGDYYEIPEGERQHRDECAQNAPL